MEYKEYGSWCAIESKVIASPQFWEEKEKIQIR